MTVSRIDPEARSTRAAANGFRASCEGDTVLARQKYTEAGEILERGSKKELPASDKHLLRFLAASQYYRAGEYKRASRLAARVNPGHLPARHRPKLEEFRKTLQSRTADDYAIRTRLAAFAHWQLGRTQEALKVLQDHPYVMERSALAWLRADLCYQEKRWRAAALFYADAIRFGESHPTPLFLCASGALTLHTIGQRDEAWEYTEHLLEVAPTALNLVTACALRYHRLVAGDQRMGEAVGALFDRAKEQFRQLPAVSQADPDVHEFMAFGYLVAAATADRVGDRTRAVQTCEEALRFDPDGESAPAFKSILATPGAGDNEIRKQATLVVGTYQKRRGSTPSERETPHGTAA